jgi:hypothetical protein
MRRMRRMRRQDDALRDIGHPDKKYFATGLMYSALQIDPS